MGGDDGDNETGGRGSTETDSRRAPHETLERHYVAPTDIVESYFFDLVTLRGYATARIGSGPLYYSAARKGVFSETPPRQTPSRFFWTSTRDGVPDPRGGVSVKAEPPTLWCDVGDGPPRRYTRVPGATAFFRQPVMCTEAFEGDLHGTPYGTLHGTSHGNPPSGHTQ
jgi:hypothetical protein